MKLKTFLFVWLLAGILASCSFSNDRRHQLTDEQLVNLMFDLHLAEVIIPTMYKTQQDSIKVLYWKKLTDAYHLSEEELRSEIELLESDPEKHKLIIDKAKMLADSIRF